MITKVPIIKKFYFIVQLLFLSLMSCQDSSMPKDLQDRKDNLNKTLDSLADERSILTVDNISSLIKKYENLKAELIGYTSDCQKRGIPKNNDELILFIDKTVKELSETNRVVESIGTSSGFIWENADIENQVYTIVVFRGLRFEITGYLMNGETDSSNFTEALSISGKWHVINPIKVEGTLDQKNIPMSWTFSSDYSTMTNSKGVVFQRIKVNQ